MDAPGPSDASGSKHAPGPTDASGPKHAPGSSDASGPKHAPGSSDASGPKHAPGSSDASGPKHAPRPSDASGSKLVSGTSHAEDWWAQFPGASERFDQAMVVDGLGDLLISRITAPLLRQEARLATDVVVRWLNRPSSKELEAWAHGAAERLADTLRRFSERATATASTEEAEVLCVVLHGEYAKAAALAEPIVGTMPLLRLYVTALRLEYFDIPLTLRLIEGGQNPDQAIRSGFLIGKYGWWPSWLLKVVTERALAGTLSSEAIQALDRCAFAELTPFQARLARRLLDGETDLISTAARRLEGLGEEDAAARLRDGDLMTVALAARLVPL